MSSWIKITTKESREFWVPVETSLEETNQKIKELLRETNEEGLINNFLFFGSKTFARESISVIEVFNRKGDKHE